SAPTTTVSRGRPAASPPAPPPPVSTPAAGEHPKPPAAGAGSGVTEWRAYAESLGIDVVDNATRADIQELVDAYEQTQAAAGGQP
ncbi:MAG TPA: hypothetical protein PLV68_17420, partial [Ilumatobacteraceae bacterium]|nr:hypothetical protein [Ilumatobacteraceae bacterium]